MSDDLHEDLDGLIESLEETREKAQTIAENAEEVIRLIRWYKDKYLEGEYESP